jgi:Ca2+-binding RTX toxin-like protein
MYVVDRGGGGISIVGQTDPESPELAQWNWEVQQDLDAIFAASAIHEPASAQGRMPAGSYASIWSDGWAASDPVRFVKVTIGGEAYQSALNNGGWRADSKLSLTPSNWDSDMATHLAWAGFANAQINLSAAGQRDLAVTMIGVKQGTITTGKGDDHVVVLSQSDSGYGNTTIRTSAGNDVVRVTAAGLSNQDDGLGVSYGARWNADYDGRVSAYYAELGGGNDQFYADGAARVAVHAGAGDDTIRGGSGNDRIRGGAGDDTAIGGNGADTFIFYRGDNHDVILDFDQGSDKLELHGFNRSAVTSSAIARSGIDGTLVGLENGSDIFLPNVAKILASDFVFLS